MCYFEITTCFTLFDFLNVFKIHVNDKLYKIIFIFEFEIYGLMSKVYSVD